MQDINSTSRVNELTTGAFHYNAYLEILDKGCAIKGLVVRYVVWLGSTIYEMGLWTSARRVA